MKMILRRGEFTLLAVYCPTRGGEDYLFDAVADAVLEEPDRPEDVDVGVEVGLSNRAPNIHLGRLVAEGLRLKLLENVGAPRADVPDVELGLLGDVLTLAGREVVNDGYLVAASEEAVGDVRPDETCTAGQQDPHFRRLVLRARRSW